MIPANWIAIVTVCVAICSWFVISALNRKNEIAKERMKFRLDILFSILDCHTEMQKHIMDGKKEMDRDFNLKLIFSIKRLTLFGSPEEVKLCAETFELMTKQGGIDGRQLDKLQNLIIPNLKSELGIKS